MAISEGGRSTLEIATLPLVARNDKLFFLRSAVSEASGTPAGAGPRARMPLVSSPGLRAWRGWDLRVPNRRALTGALGGAYLYVQPIEFEDVPVTVTSATSVLVSQMVSYVSSAVPFVPSAPSRVSVVASK